jgi:hypothetical protein
MRTVVALLVTISVAAHARAQVPLGPELQVNTYTTGYQGLAVVAAQGDGFVVAWHAGANQDGSGYGVFGRRFDGSGAALDAVEFQVNAVGTGLQGLAAVAADATGRFVVGWGAQDGSDYGIFARRFDASGAPQGGDFRVNSYTTARQTDQRIALDAIGNFVVAWRGGGINGYGEQDGDSEGVFAQRYDAVGAPQGGEFLVNSYTTGSQGAPAVAYGPGGEFVVVWDSIGSEDGSLSGIFGQRFSALGAPLGLQFLVNAYTTGGQYRPAIATDAAGNIVVAWESEGYLAGRYGIFARQFDAAGAALGPEFQVDAYTTARLREPSVSSDASGNFVVAWTSPAQDGDGRGVFARRFDAAGVPEGDAFQVNSHTTGDQRYPSVGSDAEGNFVVVWSSDGQDGDGYGVFLRRYAPDVIFRDGFESGNLSGWDSSNADAGDLSTSPAAALASTSSGLQGFVDDTAGLYVHDDSPNDENRYRARFYFDPNGFDPGEAQLHRRTRLLIGFEEGPTRRVFAVVLRRLSGAYAVMARVRLDDNSQRNTAFVPISDGPHWVELDWRRASGPDANDGRFEFWVDGVSVFSAGDVDDSVSSVDFVRLGALSVKAGASGTLYWDEFESRRHGFIGP